jgi:hypothetical protein
MAPMHYNAAVQYSFGSAGIDEKDPTAGSLEGNLLKERYYRETTPHSFR